MTTRINMRNISRKNLNVEIRPRNDGSVVFAGDPPKNAIMENGGVKFTLATKKLDRGSILIPNEMDIGDLYINTINDKQIGKNLLGWWDDFYEYANMVTPHSLAQLGIGMQWYFRLYNAERNDFNDSMLVLVNNTNSPTILNGVVLSEAYNPSMPVGTDGSMTDSSMTDSSMTDSSMGDSSMGDSSMGDGGFNNPGTFGEYIPSGNVSLNISRIPLASEFQDPEANNPTFVQESGEWGMVLGERNHRAGTYVYWKVQLPGDSDPQLSVMFYLPYRYTDKFGNVTDGQAIYTFTRADTSVPWLEVINFDVIRQEISAQVLGTDGRRVMSPTTFEKEFTFCFDDWPSWAAGDTMPSAVEQLDEFIEPQYTLEGTPYYPTTGLVGPMQAVDITGQTYVGIDNGLNDVYAEITVFDPQTESEITVPGIHHSDSILELKPNDPVYVLEEIVPENYVFINLAQNQQDEDGLGFTGENTNNFIITSAGINNANVWFNADGSIFAPPSSEEL